LGRGKNPLTVLLKESCRGAADRHDQVELALGKHRIQIADKGVFIPVGEAGRRQGGLEDIDGIFRLKPQLLADFLA